MNVIIVLTIFVRLCCLGSFGKENNVCPTFKDYYTIQNNSNCWYDLAAEHKAPDIIKMYGYPLIEYKVQTKDGYILNLFRIPSDNVKNPHAKNQPILLQHGLVATCSNFLGLGKNSLAFVLSDAGYDVWLSNYRGNQYSEEHLNLTVHNKKFWDYSMDEIALYDLPAILDTIIANTNQKGNIIFLGHSLGTTVGLMYSAAFPEAAKSTIKRMVLISPAYTLSNMISPYKNIAPFADHILRMAEDFDMIRLMSQAEPSRNVVRQFCLESPVLMQLCFQIYNLFYGRNTEMGPEIIPVYFNQLPGGTALKVYKHAADLTNNNFRMYDYGIEENLKKYESYQPPDYDISKIEIPTYIIYSISDWATTKTDSLNLYYSLPKTVRSGIYEVDVVNFNHMDFLFGRRAKKLVYEHLLKILDKNDKSIS